MYLDHNSIIKSAMRVNKQDFGLAVIKIKFNDLLMDLLLTMDWLGQSLLQTAMNKWWVMVIEPEKESYHWVGAKLVLSHTGASEEVLCWEECSTGVQTHGLHTEGLELPP